MKYINKKKKEQMIVDKNSGTVYEIVAENNGSITAKVFKSEADRTAFNLKATPETTPETITVYTGTKVKDLIKDTTTIPKGKTMEDVLSTLQEQAFIAQIVESPRSLPRSKFDVIPLEIK